MDGDTTMSEAERLLDAARGGERAALARLLTMVERGGAAARAAARAGAAADLDGTGYTVGITGAPGAGKSTLTNALVRCMRQDEVELAVLAIDPSSPFTGGAILGDRIRMSEHALDPGVFIRSMATRGHLGGLGLATPAAARVLHAAGRPWVLIETVGVGQVEVEVAASADTTVVVVNPGWGDAVQANKAGLLEIADVFVINKADRPGAAETARDLDAMLGLVDERSWTPPIVLTVAPEGRGVAELWQAVLDHRHHLEASGELFERRSRRIRDELVRLVTERLRARAVEACGSEAFESLQARVADGTLDLWSAADELMAGATSPEAPGSGHLA